ncbi:hypothetical protein PHYSODRAFT_354186 [Phytophthora sojae]|uniref:O-methyltransferase domain-containing protein n=1 Tax=Phytophthora sojae (strain P6497) TaxID=1094619 RepID=G4Z2C6_PHYSP|nr:hypothetical protein PHYSODRAFT_354186 [Phytophthora sojae]EGZ19270.1 hypothetical protein PHYSODRAFT_354186 [Phytophthora sojae]|eukprot:XP_009521987.1 hypothetical protein PHYSODRAFT_354186 [Phytophthora sojae]
MVELAGLSDHVTVHVGPFSKNYEVLRGQAVDVYFIDHDKKAYLQDSKLIIGSETLVPGSVVIADNVGLGPVPGGKNEYIEFVEESPKVLGSAPHRLHEARRHDDARPFGRDVPRITCWILSTC